MTPLLRFNLLFVVLSLASCDGGGAAQPTTAAAGQSQPGENPAVLESGDPDTSYDERVKQTLSSLEAGMKFKLAAKPRTGDLDMMAQERLIRVLTVYGAPRYFLDAGQEKGLTYELFKLFEKYINEKENTRQLKIHVMFIPVARDMLIPSLLNGRGDVIAAGLTITPEREEQVDFSDPVTREISEVLVTGPSAPRLESVEELSGQTVYVRASSSYRSSLDALNEKLREQGGEQVNLLFVDEHLEDEDLLEMVSAGLIPWAVVDDYKADIWAGAIKDLTIRKDLVFRSGGRIGYAFRKDSPKLAAALNDFMKTHNQGTLTGNVLIKRYLEDYDFAKNALAGDDYERFRNVVELFSRYGEAYGIDYLLVAAQGYQESRLDQNARSAAGAIGIMQLLPSTAADSNVGIPDITKAEPNIHAGIKYLDFIRNQYFSDSDIDAFNRTLFAMAAYNAGPARIGQLREKAATQGYDPNQWFDNVELVAAAEIGRETVEYVANILKYYVTYNLTLQHELMRQQAVRKATGG
jgi:membrane-bound lytic murein transglycosylase MltF